MRSHVRQQDRAAGSKIMRPSTALFAVAVLALGVPVIAQSSGSPSPASQPPVASQPGAQPQDTSSAPKPDPGVSVPSTPSDSKTGDNPDAKTDSKPDAKADTKAAAKTDSIPSPGDALDPHIKKGSEDDVDAVGTRNIGGRGLGNWYSRSTERSAWASSTPWRSRSRRT